MADLGHEAHPTPTRESHQSKTKTACFWAHARPRVCATVLRVILC